MIAAVIPDGAVIAMIPLVFVFLAWLVKSITTIESNTNVTKEVLSNHERRITAIETWQDSTMVPAWRVTTQTTTVEKDPEQK